MCGQHGSTTLVRRCRRTRKSSPGPSNTRTQLPVRAALPSLLVPCTRALADFFLTLDTSGTCSMLPRDKGGVVDPRLKVGKINKNAACASLGPCLLTWPAGVRHAQLARRRSFHSPVTYRRAHPEYIIPISFRALYPMLILGLSTAYVYGLAEQGKASIYQYSFLVASD